MIAISKQVRAGAYILTAAMVIFACSKGGETPVPPPPAPPPVVDPCAGLTVSVSATSTEIDPCGTGSTVTVTASGSTGFTYSLDGGAFQSSNVFTAVAKGDHTVSAKTSGGCTKSAQVTVAVAPAGPLFSALRTMIVANCNSCHSGAGASGGRDYTNDCTIVTNADRIKARAVDGNPSFMPQSGQLSAADKKKITDWIAAGAKYTN